MVGVLSVSLDVGVLIVLHFSFCVTVALSYYMSTVAVHFNDGVKQRFVTVAGDKGEGKLYIDLCKYWF